MRKPHYVGSALFLIFVLIVRTFIALRRPSEEKVFPHDDQEAKHGINKVEASGASTDVQRMDEMTSIIHLLKTENKRLKTQYVGAKVISVEMESLQRENEELKTQHKANFASSLVKIEHGRSEERHDGAIECWDKMTFHHRHYVEKHEINETNLNFFTDRNSRACRRARTNYGDETIFLPVLRKLARRECITVLVLGGSISKGNRAGWIEGSYSAKMIESLNMHMPCRTAAGEQANHTYHNLAVAGSTSEFHARNIQSSPQHYKIAFEESDVVINEFAVNDGDGSLTDVTGIDSSKTIQYWTEVLIQMLKLKCPQAPIIYLEASATKWNIGPWHTKRPPPYSSDTKQHLDVLKYYDIMQIDMMRMFGPLGTMEKNAYLDDVYFMDTVHPGLGTYYDCLCAFIHNA